VRIAIIGTGGVGAHFGSCLIRGGEEVHLVTTPRHVEAIRGGGVVDLTDEGEARAHPASVTSDPGDIGPVDAVVVAVKLYQFEDATGRIGPLIGPGTVALTLQNGVTAPGMLGRRIGADHVLPGTANIVAWLEGPGRVRQTGGRPAVAIAARPLGSPRPDPRDRQAGGADPRAQALADAFARGGVSARLARDIDRTLWEKFALICTMGGVNALAHATTGEVRSFPPTRRLMEQSLAEVRAVATARGVALTDEDCARVLAQLDAVQAGSTTSMQRDLEQGRPSEFDALNGALVALADESGVDVPLQRVICAVLGLHAHRGHV
jgi:2-dehydropantoate 2-reductase